MPAMKMPGVQEDRAASLRLTVNQPLSCVDSVDADWTPVGLQASRVIVSEHRQYSSSCPTVDTGGLRLFQLYVGYEHSLVACTCRYRMPP